MFKTINKRRKVYMEQKNENIISLQRRQKRNIRPENNSEKAKRALYSLLRKRIDEQFIELIYLSPRDTLVPTFMEDDVLLGVQTIFSYVFESIVEFVEEISNERGLTPKLEVLIQSSYDSTSDVLIIGEGRVLFRTHEKPHRFIFDSKEELIDYMFCVFEDLSLTYFSMSSDELLERYSFSKVSKGGF